ncbi:hypothetical protein Lal_00024974 [Lupinus albus]|nr:hypothetical protein Lal_00024974 [Lupinus albus]
MAIDRGLKIDMYKGFIFQAPKFASSSKHTGADMRVPHRLYKKTTITSAGYCFITLACYKQHN